MKSYRFNTSASNTKKVNAFMYVAERIKAILTSEVLSYSKHCRSSASVFKLTGKNIEKNHAYIIRNFV